MEEVEIIRSSDGFVRLDTRTDGDTAGLSREQIGDLFGRDVKTVGKQLASARLEKLADASSVVKFATVQQEGTVATALLRNLTGKGRGMGETPQEKPDPQTIAGNQTMGHVRLQTKGTHDNRRLESRPT